MIRHHFEIDYDLAERVLSAEAVAEMRHFNVQLFDIAAWIEEEKKNPCISSLFVCSAGGSHDIVDETYGHRFVHNGTLVGTAEISECYYAAWLAQQGRKDTPDRAPLKDGEGFVITFKLK
jgi:hypothetical protein